MENLITTGGSTALIRRQMLEQVGGFDQTIRFGEDWDMWLRLLWRWSIKIAKEPLASVRIHDNAQCHVPSLDKADRFLADHLLVLDNLFNDLSKEEALPPNTRARAFAKQYAQAAYADYALFRPEHGRQRLEIALRLCPDEFSNESELVNNLVQTCLTAASLERTHEPSVAISCLDSILGHLPESLVSTPSWKRKLGSELYVRLAFLDFEAGTIRQAGAFAATSILYHPRWIRNLGLVSILVQSVVGRRAWKQARTVRRIVIRSVVRRLERNEAGL